MNNIRISLRSLFLIVAVASVLIVAVLKLVDSIAMTQVSMTHTAIGETSNRLHIYAKSHGQLPEKLEDLPDRPGYINMIVDEWGRDLIYDVDDDGVITLASLGHDGKKGGRAWSTDIVYQLASRNEDGIFSAELLSPALRDEVLKSCYKK